MSDRTRAIWVQTNYGSTSPKVVEQDIKTFKNNLYSAEYMIYRMKFGELLKAEGFTKDWFTDLHELVQNEAMKWSMSSEYLSVYVFSEWLWERQALGEVVGDFGLVMLSIIMIFLYANMVLGSCSPLHFRSASASIGIFCVVLSVMSGYGLAAVIG